MDTRFRRPIVAGLALLVVVFLSACSSPTGSSSPEEDTSASPPAASDTAETGTVEQWASVIAPVKADWEDWREKHDEYGCTASSNDITCSLSLTTATFMAQTAALVIGGASDPESLKFIAAEPPTEIAGLYDGTLQAAESAESAALAWSDADCGMEDAPECAALTSNFDFAIDQLEDELEAWAPYL